MTEYFVVHGKILRHLFLYGETRVLDLRNIAPGQVAAITVDLRKRGFIEVFSQDGLQFSKITPLGEAQLFACF